MIWTHPRLRHRGMIILFLLQMDPQWKSLHPSLRRVHRGRLLCPQVCQHRGFCVCVVVVTLTLIVHSLLLFVHSLYRYHYTTCSVIFTWNYEYHFRPAFRHCPQEPISFLTSQFSLADPHCSHPRHCGHCSGASDCGCTEPGSPLEISSDAQIWQEGQSHREPNLSRWGLDRRHGDESMSRRTCSQGGFN